MKKVLKSDGFQSLIASLICVILGLFIGYIVLLIINPEGAFEAILAIIKNFLFYPSGPARMKYFGATLVKTAPLVMCSLSILFAYKVGLFNIGVAGQYCAGIGASIYCALALNLPWYFCLLAAVVAGGILGTASGMLKAYCNVNEVISGIMLNWICLYTVNGVLKNVKEPSSPYTYNIANKNTKALLPNLGLDKLFGNNKYVTIAIPLAIVVAIVVMIILDKTKIGYELKATGLNKNAAKYAGIKEKKNIIISLAISGGVAGAGAAFYYLTGVEQWMCTSSAVPNMGFNGIASAFLGALNPIGTLISSFFIQHITNGGGYVDKTVYCSQISDLISSIIIYLCGFVLFFKTIMKKAGGAKK
ncbi:MAG: ABC transporter permease [Oscillospiraceae bacterium]|nr:ABC transporter permease [Candidatus Limimonas coprohippi]